MSVFDLRPVEFAQHSVTVCSVASLIGGSVRGSRCLAVTRPFGALVGLVVDDDFLFGWLRLLRHGDEERKNIK